ncbi:MAG TPA: alpha/beta fold hydrolase [Pseudonocardiaceae bacterium]
MTTAVVFFPGAGSFGNEFRKMVPALGCSAFVARYPGRHGRDFGIPAESFDALVGSCVDQVTAQAGELPVLAGHSFGAYVAFATALRLQEAGRPVGALAVSGAASPGPVIVPAAAAGAPNQVAAYLTSVDPALLTAAPSPDWRDVIIGTTADDMRLLRGYEPGRTVLNAPLHAAHGAEDPLTAGAGVAAWRSRAGTGFSARVFPGGHSDFLGTPDWLSWINGIRDGIRLSRDHDQ